MRSKSSLAKRFTRNVIGPVGLFGLLSDIQYCWSVLCSEAFPECHSVHDIVPCLLKLNHLEQGGVYLYVGILLASVTGILIAIGYFVKLEVQRFKTRAALHQRESKQQ